MAYLWMKSLLSTILQEDIIDRLLEGKASDSEEIVTILQEVSQVKESMLVGNIQASDIRARLTSS